MANAGSNTVSVLLGDGKGGFSAAGDVTVGPTPSALALGYVNSDDALDLVVANADASTVWVLLGDGQGNFRRRAEVPEVPVGFAPNALALGESEWRQCPRPGGREHRLKQCLGAVG